MGKFLIVSTFRIQCLIYMCQVMITMPGVKRKGLIEANLPAVLRVNVDSGPILFFKLIEKNRPTLVNTLQDLD